MYLGVTLDRSLTFSNHIFNLTRSSYFHLRRLSANQKSVSIPVFTSIIHAFICSRIDYCNSLLIGLPKVRLSPIQTVLNASARLVPHLPRFSHISFLWLNNFIGFLSRSPSIHWSMGSAPVGIQCHSLSHLVSFWATGTGSGTLGFRPCWCPSPFPSPSISRCFPIHSSSPAIEFHSCFFFTTDVSAPIRSTLHLLTF